MVSTAPPTLVLQASRPETIPDHYKRFVENRFREAFGLRVPAALRLPGAGPARPSAQAETAAAAALDAHRPRA